MGMSSWPVALRPKEGASGSRQARGGCQSFLRRGGGGMGAGRHGSAVGAVSIRGTTTPDGGSDLGRRASRLR